MKEEKEALKNKCSSHI